MIPVEAKLEDVVRELKNRTVSKAVASGIRITRRRRTSSTWKRMIYSLRDSGHSTAAIARALGLSRTTIYYYLHPDKYIEKLEYVRRFRKKGSWELEQSDWELENG